MANKSSSNLIGGTIPTAGTTLDHTMSGLEQEYLSVKALFDCQTQLIQRFLETQARHLVDAILHNQLETRFLLPDRLVLASSDGTTPSKPVTVPADQREQVTGSVLDRLTRADMRNVLRHRLNELETSPDPGVAASATLIRYAVAIHMVHQVLPSGRSVKYMAAEGEEIPTLPSSENVSPDSALMAATDAIGVDDEEKGPRGELQTPFVPAARRFYLPQWVAFDIEDNILVNSVNEAEAHIVSMQRFLSILHSAVALAPYFIADPIYQQKRYGMLGQLINQGRALAKYETGEMILTIRRRARSQDLNRGLSLSLPYFDDQELQIHTLDFEVIPAGRIMFVAAFVVRAMREEMAKVAQDTRLSPSTRKYLLAELELFELAFAETGKTL